MEIGSEFWVEPKQYHISKTPMLFSQFGQVTYTSSGRSAYSLLLTHIHSNNKRALLPSFLCESVIKPFELYGYHCDFYHVDEKLSPILQTLPKDYDGAIFVHMGYFGVKSNHNLHDYIQALKKKSVIIVEDVTHTIFSQPLYEETDYYIASIRKWLGLPSGGFLASKLHAIKSPINKAHTDFVKLRKSALHNKYEYIKYDRKELRLLFLNQIREAESMLDKDYSVYSIDVYSQQLLSHTDFTDVRSRRKANFNQLAKGINETSVQPVFSDLQEDEFPLFFPIVVKDNRNHVRDALINEQVYCPIHWPIPNRIASLFQRENLYLYENLLSIPCDQRYSEKDMERILTILKDN